MKHVGVGRVSCQGRSSALPAMATRKKKQLCVTENGHGLTDVMQQRTKFDKSPSLSFYPPLIDWCRPFPPALLSQQPSAYKCPSSTAGSIPQRIPIGLSKHLHPQSMNEQDTQKQNENKN